MKHTKFQGHWSFGQWCIPSFKVIGHLVLERKIYLKVFTIYGHGGHVGHVTRNV